VAQPGKDGEKRSPIVEERRKKGRDEVTVED